MIDLIKEVEDGVEFTVHYDVDTTFWTVYKDGEDYISYRAIGFGFDYVSNKGRSLTSHEWEWFIKNY
jgi:hypothetical protein